LIAAVPVVLFAVFRLPLATRETLVFEYAAPSVRSAFTAPFVHFDGGHLLFNLLAYALVAASDRHTQFRIVFVSLLLACPAALSYLNLTIVRNGISFGFSGVLMALYGYLPLALAQHLQSELDLGRARRTGPLYFFVGLALVTLQTLRAVLNNPVSVTIRGVSVSVTWVLVATLSGLAVGVALVVVLYALSITDADDGNRRRLADAADAAGHFELAVLATVLFLVIPFTTFPVDPIVGGRVVNLFVHFLGYALGFIASYVFYTAV
jgi:membrane associated rhomboid family serine protease